MKQTKQILYSLLMAIVMMAMSPMRAWAQEADSRMAVFTELNGVTATFEDGNYPWGLTEHEGFDALTSTNQDMGSTTSTTTIKLNCEQCIMLSFNYAVSSEEDYDLLTIVVDGKPVVEGISGTKSGVYEKLLDANGNGHTITMSYTKDVSDQDNDDCGYIYNIKAVADAHQHQFNDNYVCTLCGFRSRMAVFDILEGVTATFEDKGDYPWGLTMYNGFDALTSTNQGMGNTTSTTTIKLACDQTIRLHFRYKTASEASDEYLIISVDGNEVVNSQYAESDEDGIATVVGIYSSLLHANANGHTITMSYIKNDNSSSRGDDYGYIYLIQAYTHQHYYNATSCDWSEDNTSATLHLECECGETADVEATTITRTEEAPTCEKDGFCTITASAAYNGKTVTDSKTETFAALGHDWQVQSDGTYACQREGCTAQSATFPIEVIESSGGFDGEGPEKLFDGDPNTKWCGSDVEGSNSFYVIFKTGKPSVLVSYSLVDAEDTEEFYNRSWSSWDIQGTNDPNLEAWELISEEGGGYQGRTFTTGNTTAYTYYKITFSVDDSEDVDENGEYYLQQMADMNITWCTEHQWGEDHKCSVCGYVCQHNWDEGKCTVCGYECQHEFDPVDDGYEEGYFIGHICSICDFEEEHDFSNEDGKCTACEYVCDHEDWENGVCELCGYHVPTFESLEALIEANPENQNVTVTVNGTIAYKDGDSEQKWYAIVLENVSGIIGIVSYGVDSEPTWEVGGTISGTLTNVLFKIDGMPEIISLDRNIFTGLDYTAPAVTIGGQEIEIALNDDGKYETTTPIVLTDGAVFTANVDFIAPSVSYTRVMGSSTSKWGTIMLPFEVSSGEKVQYYDVSEVNLTEGVMTATPVETVAAGHPCLFKRLDESNLTAGSSEEILISKSTTNGNISSSWKLVGTYTAKVLNAGDGDYYYISADKFWHATGTVNVKPYRAYFIGEAPASAAKALTIVVDDGEETRIEAVMDSEGNIHDASSIYDMQGRKLNSLQKGINIVNGKKVVVK